MPGKILITWRLSVIRQRNVAVLKRFKLRLDCCVRKKAADLGREKQPQFIIETDQPLVEGGVMEAVEADAVLDIEAFCFVTAPWENMGSDEKSADGKSCEATAVAVVVEDDLTEIVLAPALFGNPGDFSFSAWREFDPPDTGAGDHFGARRDGLPRGWWHQRIPPLQRPSRVLLGHRD